MGKSVETFRPKPAILDLEICLEVWSGRRDSNPQPSAWEADALPLRHTRSKGEKKIVKDLIRVNPRINPRQSAVE